MRKKILLVGDLASVAESLLEEISAAGLEASGPTTPEEALSILSREEPFAIVFEAGSVSVATVCMTVRGNPRYDSVPLIAFVTNADERVLAPVFAAGTDDYLPLGERGDLEDKLRSLAATAERGSATYTRARAVVADIERERRVQYARTLRQASYDVHFALDTEEVDRVVRQDQTVQLVLADVDLPPSGSIGTLESLRADPDVAARPIWIALGPAARQTETEPRLLALGRAAWHDRSGPPENLVYAINSLQAAPAVTQRSSERLLYGAPASFRLEGRTNVTWGATFNVSRGGVYLRTLAPPPFGSVLDVRMAAPVKGPPVELRAKVVWRKEFGARSGAPGPAGMGIELYACDPEALAEYEAGYDRLRAQSTAR